ncbi:Ribosomal small subunit pseudouridine synthase A [Vibrio stylophorae]|uniref:Pseudouridine synthase n=1 Tax=Vibrio stylophorae TaxID=659351 RepID=A0ABM8ZSU8_9VIBR|nr:16S rRNA pseudouridine(516) synthase RsuA [Vibrio stylophorae]CAH0533388.1 Ribosomal small subunit pseudouridine synthase A [Vibrio stylophorae]
MRLDKFLCDTLGVSRKEAGRIIRSGDVEINGVIVKQAATKVSNDDDICWDDRPLSHQGVRYFMMNKPQGVVCANEDDLHPTVFTLMDEVNQHKMHTAGRLDVDTTGLLLITDDGQWSHRITSPRHRCPKTYYVELAEPLCDDAVERCAQGILLRGEEAPTQPATLEVLSPTQALITIAEGKYHQVKRMFAALGNKVEALHRERIGELELDEMLEPGEYRPLTEQEIALFLAE